MKSSDVKTLGVFQLKLFLASQRLGGTAVLPSSSHGRARRIRSNERAQPPREAGTLFRSEAGKGPGSVPDIIHGHRINSVTVDPRIPTSNAETDHVGFSSTRQTSGGYTR